MMINKYGQVSVSADEIFDALYSGKVTQIYNLFFDETTCDQFNQALQVNKDKFEKLSSLPNTNLSIEEFDKINQNTWFFPNNYCPNLIEELLLLCNTQEQKDRVYLEINLFTQHNMFDLLYYLKYLVDTMRNNNIVWGVGRGSSVASYILYLIGVHKIDSIKYGLDINEFLKEI